MKITLTETEGWVAGTAAQPQTLDLTGLDEESAREGRELVARLMSCPGPSKEVPLARDDMDMTIDVEDQGNTRSFSTRATSMTREFANLVSWLKRRLRENRGQ